MKKLTAGIFATLLTVVSVGAADAKIASQGYVDQQVEGVSGQVTTLSEQVSTNTDDITTLKGDAQTAGSVAKSVADAIASEVSRANGAYDSKGSAAQALTDAKSYADTELAKKQNILKSGENVVVNGDGNVISSVTAKDGTVTFTTTSVATSETVTGLTNRVGKVETDLAGKADKSTTLAGYGITDAYTKGEVDSALSGKQATLTTEQQNAVNSGITTEKVATYDGYAAQIAAKADEADLANYATTTKVAEDLAKKQDKYIGTESNGNILTVGADGNITTSRTISSDKVSGLGSLATKSTVSSADIAANAAIAKTQLASDVQTSLGLADTAVQQAALGNYETKDQIALKYIPKPGVNCQAATAKCVLTTNGTEFVWEDIARDDENQ